MRWLGLLAILIVGAAIYLLTALSGGPSEQPRRTAAAPEAPREPEPPTETPAAAGSSAPVRETKPIPVPDRPRPTPTAPVERPATPAGDPPPVVPTDAKGSDAEEREWTEQERWQKLWAANGRFEKGNYPGAVELANEIARRYPPWQEDAWKVAIKAHCAMSEPDKAAALFQKMTDAGAIEEITTYCTEQNVPLARPTK